MLPLNAVSSYLTFSPSPLSFSVYREGKGLRKFSVALSVPLCFCHGMCLHIPQADPALHRCIALRCPDFPPYRQWRQSDNPACSNNFKEANAKITRQRIKIFLLFYNAFQLQFLFAIIETVFNFNRDIASINMTDHFFSMWTFNITQC